MENTPQFVARDDRRQDGFDPASRPAGTETAKCQIPSLPDARHRSDRPRCGGRESKFLAATSIHEGFGLVLVEAMAAGKPVVATRAGAIPEVVVDGETGYLTDAGDCLALRHAFEKLLDPAVRERLGAAGRQRVKEKFTLDRMFAETDALYASCLAHYGKKPAAVPNGGR